MKAAMLVLLAVGLALAADHPCSAYGNELDCQGHGKRVNGVCECDKLYDAVHNKTTIYSGECCQKWEWTQYDSWTDSSSSEWSSSTSSSWKSKHQTSQKSGGDWTSSEYWANWTRWTNSSSWQDAYCWCGTKSTTTDKVEGACTVGCWSNTTCNNNGLCDDNQVCQCYDHFRGEFCDECELGWKGVNCDVCAEDWYPEGKCNVYCKADHDQYGCNGLGKCNKMGTCDCEAPYAGNYCTRCKTPDYIHGVYPSCKFCSATTTCGDRGQCDTDGNCLCDPRYTGAACDKCAVEGEGFPACSLPPTAAPAGTKGSAADSECAGPNLALPIILAILLTLLVLGGAFAAYKMWQGKQAAAGGGKSSNWNEFDDQKGSTSYSQL